MFPPKDTRNVKEWLENLTASLVRAGLGMNGDACLDEIEECKHSVMIRIAIPIPKEGWGFLRTYMQQYAKASGWRIEKIRQVRGALLFLASRA